MAENKQDISQEDIKSLLAKLAEFQKTLPEREQTALAILLQEALGDDVEGYAFSSQIGTAFAPTTTNPSVGTAFAPAIKNPYGQG